MGALFACVAGARALLFVRRTDAGCCSLWTWAWGLAGRCLCARASFTAGVAGHCEPNAVGAVVPTPSPLRRDAQQTSACHAAVRAGVPSPDADAQQRLLGPTDGGPAQGRRERSRRPEGLLLANSKRRRALSPVALCCWLFVVVAHSRTHARTPTTVAAVRPQMLLPLRRQV